MMRIAAVLALALQTVSVGLIPGERAEVTCADGVFGTIAAGGGLVTVPCGAVPPPPPPGTVVMGDSVPLPWNGGGVVIHESSGFFVAGPGSAPRLTADGAFQVDDRAGGAFHGLECALDSIEVFAGGDYRGGTDGQALIRVYQPGVAQVTSGALTPTPGWSAVSEAIPLTSADAVTWRRFTFIGGNRIVTAPGMWFAVDWQPTTNDYYNILVVTFNLYDGATPYVNDGYTLRVLNNQGVPVASPAYRIYEAC